MPSRAKRKVSSDSPRLENSSDNIESTKRRNVNLYDAVAGRVGVNGFIRDPVYGQNEAILAPEEALFRARGAPERFQEDDFYWADRHLPQDCLPESDLLEAIHVFASDYYHYTTSDQGYNDAKSLDGSALLALGILLEESVRSILGETGDMAFVEGQLSEDTVDALLDLGQETGSASSVKITIARSRDSSRRSTKRQRRR